MFHVKHILVARNDVSRETLPQHALPLFHVKHPPKFTVSLFHVEHLAASRAKECFT